MDHVITEISHLYCPLITWLLNVQAMDYVDNAVITSSLHHHSHQILLPEMQQTTLASQVDSDMVISNMAA